MSIAEMKKEILALPDHEEFGFPGNELKTLAISNDALLKTLKNAYSVIAEDVAHADGERCAGCELMEEIRVAIQGAEA